MGNNLSSSAESENEGSTLTTLKTIDGVCRDHSGNGIFSIGANAALQAMAPYWAVHLAEGHPPEVISKDIHELMMHLAVLRAELIRRLTLVPTDALLQVDISLSAEALALKYGEEHPEYTRSDWQAADATKAPRPAYWTWVRASSQAAGALEP